MKEPTRFSYALRLALGCVLISYVFIGEGVALVYARIPGGVPDNMLLAVNDSSVVVTCCGQMSVVSLAEREKSDAVIR